MKTKPIFGTFMLVANFIYSQGLENPDGPPVIDDPDPCCMGNYCGYPVKPLFGDRQQELDRYNFFYTGDQDNTAKVNVGYNCGSLPSGKFNVKTDFLTTNNGISGLPASIGISTDCSNSINGIYTIGLKSNVTTLSGSGALGILSEANSPIFACGIQARSLSGGIPGTGWFHYGGAFDSEDPSNDYNIGAWGQAKGGLVLNIGVGGYAKASGPFIAPYGSGGTYPVANIGIYGTNGMTGIYTTPSNNWAGWFDNDLFVNGYAYCTGSAWSSDRKFKKDIKTIENASDIIRKLNPSSYFFNTENEYGMNFSEKKQYGFISQEIELVLPELVLNVHKPASINEKGKEVTKAVDYKALNYIAFISLLTKGMQEQQYQIDQLLATNREMEQKLIQTGINGTGSAESAFQMSQNEPNPFTHETVVKYILPQTIGNAYMAVYDLTGKQITTLPITEKGASSIIITSEKLPAGIYIYSIVADGKIVDSKRMVVESR